jgi:hypothetical protein
MLNMTISIGLIPNRDTVMLIQDAEGSYTGLGFEQDIFSKIKGLNPSSIAGIIGSFTEANETVELIRGTQPNSGLELRTIAENAYHEVREKHFFNSVLRKYGFNNIREVTSPSNGVQVDPSVKDDILRKLNTPLQFSLMLASNYGGPELVSVDFPGDGKLLNEIKEYGVGGSGYIMAIEKMGVELAKYRWKKELSIDEGIDVLMKAGKASELHTGVGGPFEIVYVSKQKEKSVIVNPDRRKINMVIYLLDQSIEEETINEAIGRMRDPTTSSNDLAEFIKTNTGVGIEFNRYFGLNGKLEEIAKA